VIGPRLPSARALRADPAMPARQAYSAPEPLLCDLPISSAEVRRIASRGFPLWESIHDMQLRNRRITLAYSDLSCRLADLLARGGGPRQANWCTYATWSSRTIGTWIEDGAPSTGAGPRWVPGVVRRLSAQALGWLVARDNGATYRSLAAGNRYVFLEIGLAVSHFVEAFSRPPGPEGPEEQWRRYWACVEGLLAEFSDLDPSWMLTECPPPAGLRLGLRQYFEALGCEDEGERAQLVLAGNLLMGAYEQRRVDGYVTVSLALDTGRAMRKLVRGRFDPERSWYQVPSALWARLMSRFLLLQTPDEQLHVAHPLPPPPGEPMWPDDLAVITLPLAQALLTRYDVSDGHAHRRRVRDWTSFDDRMNYITNLFRSRQQHAALFSDPFPPEVARDLLAGILAPDARTPVPPGEPAG
jgi:hypothetical protein